jgi:hypothetical protein
VELTQPSVLPTLRSRGSIMKEGNIAYVGIHIFFGGLMALLFFGKDFIPRVFWLLLLVLYALCVAALVLYQVTKRNSDS